MAETMPRRTRLARASSATSAAPARAAPRLQGPLLQTQHNPASGAWLRHGGRQAVGRHYMSLAVAQQHNCS